MRVTGARSAAASRLDVASLPCCKLVSLLLCYSVVSLAFRVIKFTAPLVEFLRSTLQFGLIADAFAFFLVKNNFSRAQPDYDGDDVASDVSSPLLVEEAQFEVCGFSRCASSSLRQVRLVALKVTRFPQISPKKVELGHGAMADLAREPPSYRELSDVPVRSTSSDDSKPEPRRRRRTRQGSKAAAVADKAPKAVDAAPKPSVPPPVAPRPKNRGAKSPPPLPPKAGSPKSPVASAPEVTQQVGWVYCLRFGALLTGVCCS